MDDLSIVLTNDDPKMNSYSPCGPTSTTIFLRKVATLHGWGIDDHVKSGCEEMQRACESGACFQVDFPGEHHMPLENVGASGLV